jgi:hypothetical protein
VAISLEKPDALTNVLDLLKPRGRVFCCSELSAPWAMSMPADGYVRFHVIERGGAWLIVEGARQATPLASGDLVIVPRGHGHILADSPKTKPVPISRLLKGELDSVILLQHGGGGAQTLMTCCSFHFEGGGHNPLLAEENLSVGETALRVGYESEAAFSKAFKRHFGQSPLDYRRSQVQTD